MMRIVVLQRGKLRDPLVAAARDEYVKRFRRDGALEVIERPERGEGSIFDGRSSGSTARSFKVLVDERGTAFTSEGLAQAIGRWTMSHGQICFALGGPYGHSPATLAAADSKLSLSSLTLNHALAHVLLIEQIYRAATILKGDPYHHG